MALAHDPSSIASTTLFPVGDRRTAQERPSACGQAGRSDFVQRRLWSILDHWRDSERRLECARQAGDAAAVTHLGIEVASLAEEYREAFDIVLGQYRLGGERR